jgi:gliding motility-associated-like protein
MTVSGGMPPYYFSLDTLNFRDTTVFSDLPPGIYSLYAKEAGNCISRLGTAIINSVDCTYQAVFAPARGETWSVPSDPEKSATIYIFSRTGTQVYTTAIRSFETIVWNGTADAGQLLPMGIYHFEIRYTDGTSFNGSVTIVR